MAYITEPIGVEVEGKRVYIRFKLPRFILPGHGLVNTEQLVQSEQGMKALPALLATYMDGNAVSAVFDLVDAPAAPKATKKKVVKSESEENE